jgi:ATP-binding cassette subfamily B protein
MSKTKKAAPKKGIIRLFELAGAHKGLVTASGILSALASVASFVPYLAVYFLIREIVAVFPDFSGLDGVRVMNFGLLALLGVFANVLLYFAALTLSHIAAYGTLYDLKIHFVAHITRLPLGFHIGTGSGALRKIMDENIESVLSFIAHQMPDMIAAFVAPVVMLVILFAVDWRYGLAVFGGIIIAFALQVSFTGGEKQKLRMKNYQAALEGMSVASVEYIRGISVVKAFRQTVYSFKRLHDAIIRYTQEVIPYTLNSENIMAAYVTITNNIYLLLIPVGILISLHSADYTAFAASFLFYLIFVPAIASILMKVMYTAILATQTAGNVERMDNILKQKTMPVTDNPVKPQSYEVVFDHVTFSYTKNREKDALNDVSFTARQGEITAIVGPSGSGKSTIAHLIPRFYDVGKGAVKIGGVDIRDMSITNLMDTVSFVFQDTWLFKQSVMENIRMGKPSATEEEVIAAAKKAQCHDFIEALPEGYQTVFGRRGARLSGGEMQRIAIARALIKSAPVLVLDEATAFADPENEWLIRQALKELMRDKTVIMIAHRLSTITDARKILVMDKGRLVEEGIHAELTGRDSRYRLLWEKYTAALHWKLNRGGVSNV